MRILSAPHSRALATLMFSLSSCVAYSVLTIIDAENVRGKSGFAITHDQLVQAVATWTEKRHGQPHRHAQGKRLLAKEKPYEALHQFTSLVIDHGSRASAYRYEHRYDEGDPGSYSILFSGPSEKADDTIARDVGRIAEATLYGTSLNGEDGKSLRLDVLRVVTSDQGLRSRCRLAFGEALFPFDDVEKDGGKRKRGKRGRRQRRAPQEGILKLDFVPSVALLTQLERELAGTEQTTLPKIPTPNRSLNQQAIEELHNDIQLRGKLFQVETNRVRVGRKKSRAANRRRRQSLEELGLELARRLKALRDTDGRTILDRYVACDRLDGDVVDGEILRQWDSLRRQAGRSELTGDRMILAENLRTRLEEFTEQRDVAYPIQSTDGAVDPAIFHLKCHKSFNRSTTRIENSNVAEVEGDQEVNA